MSEFDTLVILGLRLLCGLLAACAIATVIAATKFGRNLHGGDDL
jgi:hypothetical protein